MGDITCTPHGFVASVAAELGNLVVAAYDQFKPPPAGRPSKWPLSPPYQLIAEFTAAPPRHGVEKFGFVARRIDTGDFSVIFRGTQTPGDWLANCDFLQADQPPGWGRAERGFSAVYGGSATTIVNALKNAGHPGRVAVAGHSLGGALATLCAADLRRTLGTVTTLYTFASPRTGNPAFADTFNAQCPATWRVVNTEDLVNTVPLAATAVTELRLTALATAARDVEKVPVIGSRLAEPLERVRTILGGENYEHVGTPVDFTRHRGSIVDNHQMETYLAALGVKIDTPLAQTAAASGS